MPVTALDRLIAAIGDHYNQANAPPLLLSSFGQKNKELLGELKDEFGSLIAAVRAAGEDRIQFIETRHGSEAVAPAAIAANLKQQLQKDSASQRQAANFFDTLPAPVQLAFCVKTEPGEQVAIDTVRPYRYTKVKMPELIRASQRIIPDKFRRPGLSLRSASVAERDELWKHFCAWAEEVRVDPELFRQGGPTTALARLIAAQPPEVMTKLVIPADIAQLLLKHS